MKSQMPKLISIISLSVVLSASSPADSVFIEVPPNNLKELSFDWLLVPQGVEFEGFINYGSSIQSTSTNILRQPTFNFSTRKTVTSAFDGQTVVLGGLVRADWQTIKDRTDNGSADNLQNSSTSATNSNNASSR